MLRSRVGSKWLAGHKGSRSKEKIEPESQHHLKKAKMMKTVDRSLHQRCCERPCYLSHEYSGSGQHHQTSSSQTSARITFHVYMSRHRAHARRDISIKEQLLTGLQLLSVSYLSISYSLHRLVRSTQQLVTKVQKYPHQELNSWRCRFENSSQEHKRRTKSRGLKTVK